jgi:hypothetical protein
LSEWEVVDEGSGRGRKKGGEERRTRCVSPVDWQKSVISNTGAGIPLGDSIQHCCMLLLRDPKKKGWCCARESI